MFEWPNLDSTFLKLHHMQMIQDNLHILFLVLKTNHWSKCVGSYAVFAALVFLSLYRLETRKEKKEEKYCGHDIHLAFPASKQSSFQRMIFLDQAVSLANFNFSKTESVLIKSLALKNVNT